MIRYLVMDVDGTLTDGVVYIGENGELCKGFYVRDGLGIINIMKQGIIPIIMTSRESEIVRKRCSELGITEIYQGIGDKKEFLQSYLHKKTISKDEVAYIADDINDYEAMKLLDMTGCPFDAVRSIKEISKFVSKYPGGRGAVREFCEYLLEYNAGGSS